MSESSSLPTDVVQPVDPKAVSKKDEPVYEEVRDGWRETFETISFVVFLVLMLKAFVAEAYVIPTGSMATTLLGDHMFLECPRCGLKYAVNASNGGERLEQVQQDGGRKMLRLQGCCQNCQFVISNPAESVDGGDKVLVLKPVYDMFSPRRHDSVVFKYPLGPQKDFGAYNYIKRLWGLPGEKLAIWGGDVYLVEKVGEKEQLKIIHKAPDKMLRMRRLVNNNDLINPTFNPPLNTSWQPLSEKLVTPAAGTSAWEPTDHGKIWVAKSKSEGMDWLRYQHQFQPVKTGGITLGNPPVDGPHLITNFMAYNHIEDRFQQDAVDWVGDLMIEAEVEPQESKGQLVLQLNKGVITAEARFNLETGKCTVVLLKNGKEVSTHEANTSLNSRSKQLVRFANFDQRLTLWVGSRLIFGDGIEYADLSDEERGPRLADMMPASIGVNQANVVIRKISLWRDIYYSRDPQLLDAHVSPEGLAMTKQEFRELAGKGDLSTTRRNGWLPYYPSTVRMGEYTGGMGLPAFYPKVDATHPSDRFNADEYFMLGDNSLASQDSRYWGQVPQRMLLGQAIWVYWPFRNFASIR